MHFPRGGGGGGSFHSKGTWGCAIRKGILFATSDIPKDILFWQFQSILVRARVCLLAFLVKEMSSFGNTCKETQIFKFWSRECENVASLV